MKIQNKSLLLNFSGYTIINLLNSLTPFIILPLLTKNLTAEDVGSIDLFTTSTLFLTPLIGLCMIQSLTKLYFTVPDKSKYLSVLATAVFLLSSTLFLLVSGILFLTDLIKISLENKLFVLLIVFYVFLSLIIEGYLLLKRNEEAIKEFGFLRLSKAFVDIVLTIVFLFYYDDYWARIMAMVISSSLIAAIIIFLIRKNPVIQFMWDKAMIKYILSYTWPLILHALFINILNYVDRYLIGDFLGMSELGKYSVIYQICMVMSLFINSFGMAWTPFFMRNMAENSAGFKPIFKQTFSYYVLTLILGGSLLYLIMPLIYKFYVGEDFLVSKEIYIALLSGYVFQGLYRFKINHLYFLEKTASIAQISFVGAMVNIGLNLIFIVKWGLYGAAFATFVSFLILYLFTELKLAMFNRRKPIY
ncbi:lipopolysaccharide biosynthesis protein [Allomuricauda sp. SCSIO 65647]|uniref:lipopolysaccharide biosynthesis protein n=1 Tax=Allomuricauda sp. SCSIO 65647 TaxID=2908843 RepID=UPI001F44242E|nr:oligosaccharide flippase family protein [Muricauda sp. SCSIO 65647]UJH69039.1 oligosaccharide flippase family protein [Muricauda sp. SCSIO 65647]